VIAKREINYYHKKREIVFKNIIIRVLKTIKEQHDWLKTEANENISVPSSQPTAYVRGKF